MIHHGQLPEGLLNVITRETLSGSSNRLGSLGGLDGLSTTEPARLFLSNWGRGIVVTLLTLEGGRGSLIELSLAIKDVQETDPELLELLGLLKSQVAKTAFGGGNGLNVGGHVVCFVSKVRLKE
jgi:hypothetical protein